MATRHPHIRRTTLALAALSALACTAHAQTQVTITGRALPVPAITGFGDAPLASTPLQAAVYGAQQLADSGITSIDGLARLDAGVSDAYNAEGYWSYLTLRGFVLDNRYNYRRDGLPINAETFVSLANKDRIEVLKGISGIQAGTSAPGGLVNLVVKRPTADLRQATLEWREDSTVVGQVDLSQRFGTDGRYGLRVNAEAARLRPATRSADGSRRALAVAGDWQVSADSKLELEFETSTRSQPSVPGFSLLGSQVPDPKSIDPRTNLNNQPWSQPVVLAGDTASLRWQQRLGSDWRFTAHGMTQRLKSDDRIAFPYGCSAENQYDRYCSDGSFDLYDFRSDGERRRVDALDLRAEGRVRTGSVDHTLTAGVLGTRTRDRFNAQAYNYAGSGLLDGSAATPAAPDALDPNTNRDERSTEWYLRDVARLGGGLQLWAGLRHTRIERQGVRTDGSRATDYAQTFTTPWLALAFSADAHTTFYASAGQGIESEVVPNRSLYRNAGEALPTLKSRQFEAGVKHDGEALDWHLATFDIRRPRASDLCSGDETPVCTRAIDGDVQHRGLEAGAALRAGAWGLDASAMWLDARRRGASDRAAEGRRPTNVPRASLKLQGSHELAAMPGLTLLAAMAYEDQRDVLPDGSITLPGWTRWDVGARWRTTMAGQSQLWRVGIDNVTDRRAWRESPLQFDHAYLFPLAARTWRASFTTSF